MGYIHENERKYPDMTELFERIEKRYGSAAFMDLTEDELSAFARARIRKRYPRKYQRLREDEDYQRWWLEWAERLGDKSLTNDIKRIILPTRLTVWQRLVLWLQRWFDEH